MRVAGIVKKYLGYIVISVLMFAALATNIFSFFEHRLQDLMYQRLGSANPEIVVVGIDETTLSQFGRVQDWSRQTMADAINILNSSDEYKPAAIAIDIFYLAESDNPEADANLARAAADGGNVVFAAQAVIGTDKTLKTTVIDYEKPFPALAESARYGFVNATIDSDGVIRSASLKLRYGEQTLRSFPVEIYRIALGEYPETREYSYIPYSGKPLEFFQGISFYDIFDEDFDPEFFAGQIILIGPYAFGMGDAFYTPADIETQMYGVEIHANVLQMLMESNYKYYVGEHTNLLILTALLLLCTITFRLVDIRILFAGILCLLAGYAFAAWQLYKQGHIITLLYPAMSLVILYIYRLVSGYIIEAQEKRKVKSIFTKYVDSKLVDTLIKTGEADSNEVGKKKNIAVLFVDVRGFTPMSESLKDQPEVIVKILNEYLELTAQAVFNNGGSVDKFIGDATMALFNGFVPLDDYVYKAVKAAWHMLRGAESVSASIKEKYNIDLGFGVGVNCGDAIVGNLGPSFRKDYTAIGDTVNTAARLESNAERSQILISEGVYQQLKDRIEAVSVGPLKLKGKTDALEVFAVVSVPED